MPLNYLEVQSQVREMGSQALQRQDTLIERRKKAAELLDKYASELKLLQDRVELAVGINQRLRCAVPVSESLTQSFPAPPLETPLVLLAADGSQINPSRHDPVEFGVYNSGAIRIHLGQPDPPREITRTRLIYPEAPDLPGDRLSEELIALLRDLAERRLLADLAAAETSPVVALTDGNLELFREPEERPPFDRLFKEYLQALGRLSHANAAVGGYVDKTRANLVVSLLELMMLKDEELPHIGHGLHPLQYVTDYDLFRQRIKPGERSAVFALQSSTTTRFKEEPGLALHFFYLNASPPGRSHLARVEIPAWVAESPPLLNRLHAALLTQCQQMGSQPYPYILHRAHEVAVVTLEEKEQLMNMIVLEYRKRGVEIDSTSFKQASKDVSGQRTRF